MSRTILAICTTSCFIFLVAVFAFLAVMHVDTGPFVAFVLGGGASGILSIFTLIRADQTKNTVEQVKEQTNGQLASRFEEVNTAITNLADQLKTHLESGK